jgi:hypothetical protein
MQTPELAIDYQEREQFSCFHDRTERFACIVTHRRAGKTVACIHDLQLGATQSNKIRPRFAYLSPFLKQSEGGGVGLSARGHGAAARDRGEHARHRVAGRLPQRRAGAALWR